ncbi:MAG: DUF1287 domain-containing protein [Acidobacteria bacterium]|nr:DUF1287 domain-containing protein [Acidobacteriota bacterium]MBI3489854.1 DUF1287 domain-containing protein [Acidobacteriota bacterium]
MRASVMALIMLGSTGLLAGVSGLDLASAAKAQIGVTRHYDGRYQKLAYPGGDLPMDCGVCSDVVIRAYRPLGIDLQVLVHEDMRRAWNDYPNLWHMRSTDRNIDHRRVPNLATFFRRHGQSLSIHKDQDAFLPGDIVTWQLVSGAPHVGIVSRERSKTGTPLVIHNIGWGAMLEDRLFDFKITGHYRYPRD